ncbi:hypothetical protein MCOR31_011989 [Pyricularia oryzae]|nr:hypothetical protein MCOR19_007460 [Pyricularia oryzae]KAI6351418.1 hypothetical protein MCOR31_011989 [Pyricularia oryzae]KAI6446733.1 hypothetical protein MCOR22_003683 [Pyricularia oryzae]KAI6497319.1 hypothetical protein MCOR18_000436 [Pyricularia oryzae]
MAQSLIGFAIAVAVPQEGTETKTFTPSTDLELPYDLGGTLAMVSVAMKRPSVVLENLPSFGDVKCADNNVIMSFKDVDYRVPLCTIDLPIYKGECWAFEETDNATEPVQEKPKCKKKRSGQPSESVGTGNVRVSVPKDGAVVGVKLFEASLNQFPRARTQSFGNATGTPGLTSRKAIFGHQSQ